MGSVSILRGRDPGIAKILLAMVRSEIWKFFPVSGFEIFLALGQVLGLETFLSPDFGLLDVTGFGPWNGVDPCLVISSKIFKFQRIRITIGRVVYRENP